MKVLASGDIHGDSSLAEKLAATAADKKVDLVVLCGDLGNMQDVPKNVLGPFAKRKQKVLIIPGNHDSFATADFLAEVYGATNLHGYTAVYDGIGFFGCGGANIGMEQLPEDEIFHILKKGFEKVKRYGKKILVSHVHPTGVKMEQFSSFVPGSRGLRRAIDELKPDLVLCSHVHEASGIEEKVGTTSVINVSRDARILDL
ncbi:MAG: metallophosphoesterase family protein [Nanoarchaeota archaeon]